MIPVRSIFALGIFAAAVYSQDIHISGTVMDSAHNGIEEATVTLDSIGATTTTDADGEFTLSATSIINGAASSRGAILGDSYTVENHGIKAHLITETKLQIGVYNVNGRHLFSQKGTYAAGDHVIALPSFGTGVHIYKITQDDRQLVFKSIGKGSTARRGGSVSEDAHALAKRAQSAGTIDDIIEVVKDGFLDYRMEIHTSDTSGIEIELIHSAGTITDSDGNEYQTVRIGNQIWTVENLRTTKYNDGSDIQKVTGNYEWINLSTGAYCYYDNDSAANADKYGALYNWYAANTGKLAPDGWRVPTDDDWNELENYLIANGYNWDGSTSGDKIGKALAAKTDWNSSSSEGSVGYDLSSNNATGFSALPGGYRRYPGLFNYQSNGGYWWSATENGASRAFARPLRYASEHLERSNDPKGFGFSVRLVRDVD